MRKEFEKRINYEMNAKTTKEVHFYINLLYKASEIFINIILNFLSVFLIAFVTFFAVLSNKFNYCSNGGLMGILISSAIKISFGISTTVK